MNIYFIVNNIKAGSTLMRAVQIRDELKKYYKNIFVIKKEQIILSEKGFYVWIKYIDPFFVKKLKSSIHVYDVIDYYIYDKKRIDNFLRKNLCHGLIVNNKYMKDYIIKNTKYNGKIFIIYHHWDPRFSSVRKTDQQTLKFGYIGSIKSLEHSDNFLHYRSLIHKYPIELIDTEIGKNVTSDIKNGKKNNYKTYQQKYRKTKYKF